MLRLAVTVCSALIVAGHVSGKLQPEQVRKLHKNARECVKETGILPKNALRVLSGDFTVETVKAKCFVKCFFDKSGFVDEQGNFLQDAIREKLSTEVEMEKLKELIKKCSVNGEDVCDTAFERYKCFFSNHKLPPELFRMQRKGRGF